MGIRRDIRRPMTRPLAVFYDEGARAAPGPSENPYEPHRKPGDLIRAWLWRQGYEDEREVLQIEAMV